MSYTTKQWRAINYYLTKHRLRPELSAYPVIRFTVKSTGEIGEVHINNIEDLYTADQEKARRERHQESKSRRLA